MLPLLIIGQHFHFTPTNPYNMKRPTGPSGHWLLGSTADFAKSTIGFIQQCQVNYPDGIAYARIAFRDFYVLLDTESIQQVMQKHHTRYKKSFAYKGMQSFLGKGLLTKEGADWLKQRRLMQPSFSQKAIVQMQDRMQKLQEEIANMEVIGESGAGLVKVTITGSHSVRRVEIDDSLMEDDKEMLEDLIAAAFNDAARRVEETQKEKMHRWRLMLF